MYLINSLVPQQNSQKYTLVHILRIKKFGCYNINAGRYKLGLKVMYP